MARKILNRKELREENEAAESAEKAEKQDPAASTRLEPATPRCCVTQSAPGLTYVQRAIGRVPASSLPTMANSPMGFNRQRSSIWVTRYGTTPRSGMRPHPSSFTGSSVFAAIRQFLFLMKSTGGRSSSHSNAAASSPLRPIWPGPIAACSRSVRRIRRRILAEWDAFSPGSRPMRRKNLPRSVRAASWSIAR